MGFFFKSSVWHDNKNNHFSLKLLVPQKFAYVVLFTLVFSWHTRGQ